MADFSNEKDAMASHCLSDDDEDDLFDYAPRTKKPRTDITRGGDARAPISVTLTDPDLLDCAICNKPFNPPVYQCKNGHTACASCCTNMKKKCTRCRSPIGYNRCWAIENILASIRIPCPNTPHGCKESFSYSKRDAHKNTCCYSHISCPHPNCTYTYTGLPCTLHGHFDSQHPNSYKHIVSQSAMSILLDNSQTRAFLYEMSEDVLFVLSRSIEPRGSLVDVVCIVPTSSMSRYSYQVTASDGVSSVMLKTAVGNTSRLTAQDPDKNKNYLLVPNYLACSGGHLKLEVSIWRT